MGSSPVSEHVEWSEEQAPKFHELLRLIDHVHDSQCRQLVQLRQENIQLRLDLTSAKGHPSAMRSVGSSNRSLEEQERTLGLTWEAEPSAPSEASSYSKRHQGNKICSSPRPPALSPIFSEPAVDKEYLIGAKGDADDPPPTRNPPRHSPTASSDGCPEMTKRVSIDSKGNPRERKLDLLRRLMTSDAVALDSEKPGSPGSCSPGTPSSTSDRVLDQIGAGKKNSSTMAVVDKSLPAMIERSYYFNIACIIVILINGASSGWQTSVEAEAAIQGLSTSVTLPTRPLAIATLDILCFLALCAEIFLRAYVQRIDYCYGPDRQWNMFDIFILVISAIELIFMHLGLTFLRMLRVVRLLRAAQLTRLLKYLHEARKMFVSIKGSVTTLFWMFVIMGSIMYITSVIIVQTISVLIVWRIESRGLSSQQLEDLAEFWGGIGKATYSLLSAVSGGKDWQDLADPLLRLSPLFAIVFLGYVSFMVFGVLNVVTGVFVNAAMEAAKDDRDTAMQTQIDSRDNWVKNIRKFFTLSDEDHDGTINLEEFEELLESEGIVAYLQSLDIDVHEAKTLFKLLDADDSGDVGVDEFVEGCVKMRGTATAVDIMMLTQENKRLGSSMQEKLQQISLETNSNLKRIEAQLGDLCTAAGHTGRSSSRGSY